jgi:outer membrane protein TolC
MIKLFRYVLFFICFSLSAQELVPPPLPLALNEAIGLTLENQLNIKITQLQIDQQKGVVQTSAGPFDPVINGLFTTTWSTQLQYLFSGPGSPFGVKSNFDGQENILEVTATKRARSGTLFTVSASLDQVFNVLLYPAPTNIGTLSFNVEQPLLRNLNYSIDTVTEIASYYELYATYMDNFQEMAQRVLNTVTQYWNTVAAKKQVNISLDAEARLGRLINDIEKLIREDQLAPADLTQPLVQLVTQQIQTIQLTQSYYSAVESLKFNMGEADLWPDIKEPIVALDDFPPVKLNLQEFVKTMPYMIEAAETYSYNIQAANLRVREQDILLQGALNETLPDVSLIAGVTKKDFQQGNGGEDFVNVLVFEKPQTNWTVGVNISIPFYNDTALGEVRQKRAQKWEAILESELLAQDIVTQLRTALSNQMSLALQLDKANEEVLKTQKLLHDEYKKLPLGFTTIFILLNFEGLLTTAYSQQVQIYTQYLQNIATIRFLTATLFYSNGSPNFVEMANVTLLPDICEMQ